MRPTDFRVLLVPNVRAGEAKEENPDRQAADDFHRTVFSVVTARQLGGDRTA